MAGELDAPPPIACMLATEDFRRRLIDIAAMNMRLLRSARREACR